MRKNTKSFRLTNNHQPTTIIMKAKIIILFLSAIALISACKKEIPGPVGPAGPQGPESRYYDMSIAINPSTTWQVHILNTNYFDGDDVVLLYWKTFGTGNLILCPYIYKQTPTSVEINIWSELSNGALFIHTTRTDGSSVSPWVNSSTMNFRIVVIKSSPRMPALGIDYSNYDEVKQYFNFNN